MFDLILCSVHHNVIFKRNSVFYHTTCYNSLKIWKLQ